MMNNETRWIQRFESYLKALNRMKVAIEYIHYNFSDKDSPKDNLIRQGLIQNFEYPHELAWKVMKDFFKARGNNKIYGSRDATREAFENHLIKEGEVWMDMINSQNATSHTYNPSEAKEIFTKIREQYYPAFLIFKKTMEEEKKIHENR